MNKGIAIAGNLIVDKNKTIDTYPEKGMLVKISSVIENVGGCVPNTIVDIAKIDKTVPLKAYGKVGRDGEGAFLIKVLNDHGIDTNGVVYSDTLSTSFTDVMNVQSTGERTFFQCPGANADYGLEDIDVDSLDCDIFHAGYILLMDKLDELDEEYGTVMARLLANVQKRGIKTSIDVVSEEGERFNKLVPPALKYCNYVVINEIEAGRAVGINPRDESGKIILENIEKILVKFFELGVKDVAIIHSPEGGFGRNSSGEFVVVNSSDIPKGYKKGSVGAGDAFCAGVLYSLYKEFGLKKAIEIGNLAATANLSEIDSISGLRSYEELLILNEKYPPRKNLDL